MPCVERQVVQLGGVVRRQHADRPADGRKFRLGNLHRLRIRVVEIEPHQSRRFLNSPSRIWKVGLQVAAGAGFVRLFRSVITAGYFPAGIGSNVLEVRFCSHQSHVGQPLVSVPCWC